jgi:dipeptidyl aminopeptidase/acylaminoacyl peptidase
MPTQPFEITVDDSSVHGQLAFPDEVEGAAPCVLVCGGFPVEAGDGDFPDQAVEALTGVGLAVATFEPRFSTLDERGLDKRRADQTVADATAAFEWLLERPDVDATRVGVLGYSTAAVIAACLAGDHERVASLCLVAPATEDAIVKWMSGDNGSEEEEPEDLPAALEESVQSLFPIDEAATFDRPTLIVHAAADESVSAEASLRYVERIEAASHQAEYVLVARADHGFNSVESRVACLELLMRFFSGMPAIAVPAGQA